MALSQDLYKVGHSTAAWEFRTIGTSTNDGERRTDREATTFGKKRTDGVQDGIGVHGDVGVLRTG